MSRKASGREGGRVGENDYGAMSPEAWRARPEGGASDEQTLARAKSAAARGDLFHPGGWREWESASDELFAKAAALLTAEELKKLAMATDFYGANWAAAFGDSPGKLRALMERGLDPAQKSSVIESWRVEGAFYAAWNGRMRALEGMMLAGFPPPGREEKASEGFGRESEPVETALQALALSLMSSAPAAGAALADAQAPVAVVTVVGKRMSPEQKAAFDRADKGQRLASRI